MNPKRRASFTTSTKKSCPTTLGFPNWSLTFAPGPNAWLATAITISTTIAPPATIAAPSCHSGTSRLG